MYNRYACPLQPYRHLSLKLLIQGHPQGAKVPHVADFKSAYVHGHFTTLAVYTI